MDCQGCSGGLERLEARVQLLAHQAAQSGIQLCRDRGACPKAPQICGARRGAAALGTLGRSNSFATRQATRIWQYAPVWRVWRVDPRLQRTPAVWSKDVDHVQLRPPFPEDRSSSSKMKSMGCYNPLGKVDAVLKEVSCQNVFC